MSTRENRNGNGNGRTQGKPRLMSTDIPYCPTDGRPGKILLYVPEPGCGAPDNVLEVVIHHGLEKNGKKMTAAERAIARNDFHYTRIYVRALAGELRVSRRSYPRRRMNMEVVTQEMIRRMSAE